jgi:hypothetical protein
MEETLLVIWIKRENERKNCKFFPNDVEHRNYSEQKWLVLSDRNLIQVMEGLNKYDISLCFDTVCSVHLD